MVTLRAFSTAAEAALVKTLLDDHGIVSSLADENSYLYGGAPLAMPVRLLVAEEQLEDAARILADPPDGLHVEPAVEKEIARATSQLKHEEEPNNPWQLLAFAGLIAIPGVMLLLQKYNLVLIAYHRLARRGLTVITPTDSHILGLLVTALSCFLVFLYFYVRRDIAREQEEVRRKN
jgi:putative signal transducing protein